MLDIADTTNINSASVPAVPHDRPPDEVWRHAWQRVADPEFAKARTISAELMLASTLTRWLTNRRDQYLVFPQTLAAFLIWMGRPERSVIERLIRADVPRDEIAREVKLEPNVIWVFERLFFDVRNRGESTGWAAR